MLFLLPARLLRKARYLSTSTTYKMDLKEVVNKLESFAPSTLAESWDNVGLLIEPSEKKTVQTVFLTNDLTEPVLDEALRCNSDMIISYHPPLFRPFKRLTSKSWKERVAVRCVENKVALYSPHTSWDCIPGGINSWLLSPYGPGKSAPVSLTKSKTFPTGYSHTLTMTGVAVSAEDLQPLLSKSGIYVNIDSNAVSVSCPEGKISDIISSLSPSLLSSVCITSHCLPPIPDTGAGRILALESPISLGQALDITKKHLGMDHIRLAKANSATLESEIKTIGVCAGSGGSVLVNVKADLIVTGEMSHHEVLDFVHRGISVILADHSNTERGFLAKVKEKLGEMLGSEVKIIISKLDKDPLQIL